MNGVIDDACAFKVYQQSWLKGYPMNRQYYPEGLL